MAKSKPCVWCECYLSLQEGMLLTVSDKPMVNVINASHNTLWIFRITVQTFQTLDKKTLIEMARAMLVTKMMTMMEFLMRGYWGVSKSMETFYFVDLPVCSHLTTSPYSITGQLCTTLQSSPVWFWQGRSWRPLWQLSVRTQPCTNWHGSQWRRRCLCSGHWWRW